MAGLPKNVDGLALATGVLLLTLVLTPAVAAVVFRVKTGRWMSPEFQEFLRDKSSEESFVQPVLPPRVCAISPAPRADPPRPKWLPRVRVIDGPHSPVPDTVYVASDASDPRLPGALRRHGINVLTADEAKLGDAPRASQLMFAARERRRVITSDRRYVALHKDGARHAGIIHAPRGAEWFQEILRVCLVLREEASQI